MSNIYIKEPPTNGKVLLVTSVGDIDIELWSKEAPRACRNFIQLCMEGYYDGTIFHRVIKDFIVQGGDPTGTGHGGESIWGKPFRDEFHSRLRFVRRGLVAMANAGKNDNGSQFFFTFNTTPELNNKHTIFGKVAGDTIYNMLKLADCETDGDDRPLYPHKVIKTKVLSNPFEDIVPRVTPNADHNKEKEKKVSKSKATKNFKLLSFGEEAEADEEETNEFTKDMKNKSKSSHDLLQDQRLSSVPAVDTKKKRTSSDAEDSDGEAGLKELEEMRERIRKKLRGEEKEKDAEAAAEDEDEERPESKKSSRKEELRKEAEKLKRDILKSRRKEVKTDSPTKETATEDEEPDANDMVMKYKQERRLYKDKKKGQRKGSDRESNTLALLAKFQSKLNSVRRLGDYEEEEEEDEEEKKPEGAEEKYGTDMSWMGHKLTFEAHDRKVIDANVAELDRYDIVDPRNPLNQRRREASKQAMKSKR